MFSLWISSSACKKIEKKKNNLSSVVQQTEVLKRIFVYDTVTDGHTAKKEDAKGKINIISHKKKLIKTGRNASENLNNETEVLGV